MDVDIQRNWKSAGLNWAKGLKVDLIRSGQYVVNTISPNSTKVNGRIQKVPEECEYLLWSKQKDNPKGSSSKKISSYY